MRDAWGGTTAMYYQLLAAAKNLHGVPLLIHGVIDETSTRRTHSSSATSYRGAGKPFRLMYEKSRHGLTYPALMKHMRQMMFDFTLEMLGGAKNGPTNIVR